MTEPIRDSPPSTSPPADRLDSWKEIASYLGRDVTTVQRWEKREGMPVHRHLHDRIGSVYAYRGELEAWVQTRHAPQPPTTGSRASAAGPPAPAATRRSSRSRVAIGIAAITVLAGVAGTAWFRATGLFWRDPIASARFQRISDFDGEEQAAALSRDGRFVAFLSKHDGPTDIWLTQIGSGRFHNLTHGRASELLNPSVRMLGFTPDGAFVTFWARQAGREAGGIGVWAVPALGGEPRPLLAGVAECDWSPDGSRLVYHTTAAGDPLFVTDAERRTDGRRIFIAPPGEHTHFPVWGPDGRYIYFVQGSLPDRLDIWRIRPDGGARERITSHNSRVEYPVLLNRRTLVYLATDPDGSGPWLYGMDVERRVPHRLISGPDRYTSLAASADGRRLVVTLANPKRTLWRVPLTAALEPAAPPSRIPLPTMTGFSPRQGLHYLLFVAEDGGGESIWKSTDGAATQLWSAPGAHLVGGPAISPDGARIGFSVRQHGQSLLYAMDADGTHARVVAQGLALQGAPAWAPDGQSITSAVLDPVEPHLFMIPIAGRPPSRLVHEYSIDPVWARDGRFVVYTGADVGTTFSVRAAGAGAAPSVLPPMTLTRGARRLVFVPGGDALIVLRGEIQHKNLWLIDLATGRERQMTNFSPDFEIRDFDISPDGRELVVERVQEQSDVVLLDLPRS
ncbi:MAG TPA: hypothetical protein VFX12_08375 [Vicinamibacterales bacterium]|nr:hypothetical protein [Vicinamibacterales bacterium]